MARGFMSRFKRRSATVSASSGLQGPISRVFSWLTGGPKSISVAAPAQVKFDGAPQGRPHIRVVDDQGVVAILN